MGFSSCYKKKKKKSDKAIFDTNILLMGHLEKLYFAYVWKRHYNDQTFLFYQFILSNF